ncbi:MAG: hypothetical protein JXQ84_00435 [Rhodospirillaceae bacterium]|nr:hypothetical protein [Rhodospirillaceae bacterium]
MAWCVVSTLPNQESRAEKNLLRQGFRAWLPLLKRERRHARRIDVVEAPFFPGYLFVELDLDRDAWSSINGTYGVRRLLCQRETPACLPDGFIPALEQAIKQQSQPLPLDDGLLPGKKVRLVDGAFVDSVGTLLRLEPKYRVALLLNILGTDVVTTVPRNFVSSVD